MSPETIEVVPRSDGSQVLYRGRLLYSDTAPRAGAERRAAAASLPPRHLIIIPSPLLWYGVERLLDRGDFVGLLLCVELEPQLAELSRKAMPPRLRDDPRVRFVPNADSTSLDLALAELGPDSFSGCDIVSLSAGFTLNRDRYRRIEAHLRGVLRQNWQNRLSLIRLGRRWLLNVASNLPELTRGCSLKDLTFEKPVVLVGAGESLEEFGPWIAQYRDSMALVAVDTALGWFASAGIMPDLVVVLEAQLINREHLIGLLEYPAAFAFELSSAPQLVRRVPPERRFFYASRFTETAFLDRIKAAELLEPWIAPRGSVAVAALEALAPQLQQPTYLLGMDFAFRLGKPHARGTGSHRWFLRYTTRLAPDTLYDQALSRPLITLTGKDARRLRSDTILAGYRDQLRDVLSSLRRPAYDLSASGLSLGLAPADRPAPVPRASAASEAPAVRTPGPRHLHGSSTVGERPVAVLDREVGLLTGSVAKLEALYHRGTIDPPALKAILRDCDYLDLDFPARVRAEEASTATVYQLLVSARHYLRVVRHAYERSLSTSPSART